MTVCQSCGMLIESSDDYGTEKDNSKNQEYCAQCYQKGKFVLNLSYGDFLEKQIELQTRMLGISPVEVEKTLKQILPTLLRWRNNSLKENNFEDDYLEENF